MVFGLINKCFFKRWDTLRYNNCHCKGIIKGRNITKSHDSWKSCVTFRFTDIINSGGGSSRMYNKFCKFSCLFCNFSDASSCIFSYLNIHVFQAVQDSWENFSFNNYFGKVNCVLCNLSKALTNISFQLSIWMRNQCSEIWDSTLINNCLSKFFSVFCNLS